MRLLRIRIEQLRQFRGPLEVGPLAPGINLFAGPNESGKSTLVQAIRAAFFERHKSSMVDDLRPWGDSSAAPSIQLDFDWQGRHWSLHKRFLKQKRCDLSIDGERFDGDEAEDKLAELLGYRFAARGASRAEHWGIPGLLWIEQGTGQDLHEAVGHAADYLKSALGRSLGEVASSAGEALIGAVTQERARILTGTGRPTGAYAEARQQCADDEAQLASLDQSIAAYQAQVDRLGELLNQQAGDAARPWRGYREAAARAEAELAAVQGLEQAQQREHQALRDNRDKQALYHDQLAACAQRQADLDHRARERQRASAALDDLEARRPQVARRLNQAQADYRAASDTLHRMRRREQHHVVRRELAQLDQDLAALAGRLDQARTLQAQLLALRGQVQANPVGPDALKQLRDIHQDLNTIDIARQAMATQLRFDLLPAQHLQLGDETLAGQGERRLIAPAEIRIPGVGTLHLRPGGADIADLARRSQAAQDRYQAALDALQANSLAHAETQAEQRRAQQETIGRHELLLKNLAPQGVDELATQQALGVQRQQALRGQLADLPSPGPDDIGLAEAESRQIHAQTALRAAEQQQGEFEKAHSLARQAAASAQGEWQRLHDALQAPDHRRQTAEWQQQLLALRAQDPLLQQALDERQRTIDAARPDILRQDIQRLGATADILEKEAQARTLDIARLQSTLDALGAHGLEEQRAEVALRLRHGRQRCDAYQRHAAALDRLLGLLNDKRRALTQRIQAPLQRHLDHYLALLFPRARLDLDDALLPRQLSRPARDGEAHDDYLALSYGAREQLGLISRLAYADLLQAAGRPTLIILDDALVHSDPQRLSHMKRILFDAARRHQILLFTCQPEHWEDLGVAAIRMEALRGLTPLG
ncbi:AAA family ATPase [Castellaniella hirudinis]|uniref:AAA family ATPase n=1 Tax=Castellaniella hirudinis TaxID=1144617 RepID=UPI0039C17602